MTSGWLTGHDYCLWSWDEVKVKKKWWCSDCANEKGRYWKGDVCQLCVIPDDPSVPPDNFCPKGAMKVMDERVENEENNERF